MKKAKKCLSLLISAIMVASLAACAGNPSSSTETKGETQAADAAGIKVAIITPPAWMMVLLMKTAMTVLQSLLMKMKALL